MHIAFVKRGNFVFSPKARWAIASGIAVIAIAGAITVHAILEKEVVIYDKEKTVEVSTFAKTVKDLLADEKIVLESEDVVIPSINTKLEDNMKIIIKRAFPVTIVVDGKEVTVRTQPDTVENILSKGGIVLNEKDKIEPALSYSVAKSEKIIITRVEEKVTTTIKPIPFTTVSRKDSNLPAGQKKIIQQGEEGSEEIKTTEILENGKVVSTSTESKVIKSPKPQIVLVGTVQIASRAGVDFAYTEKRRMMASAYTYTGHRTATGTTPRAGVVAVDPNVIPLGTRLYVEGYGFARAEDTGGAIKGNEIDLFFNTTQECRYFGRHQVTIYVLK